MPIVQKSLLKASIRSLPGPSQSVGRLQSCLDCIVLLAGRQAYPWQKADDKTISSKI